jgi:hypothetical protein
MDRLYTEAREAWTEYRSMMVTLPNGELTGKYREMTEQEKQDIAKNAVAAGMKYATFFF